ncbi:hypothetical protein [Marinobacter sp. SS8-8]|uniref:hypothetical protein n=1 Tax=Marinobacter sp. SS8-8 TaxID=3050452 RepID=UPI0026DF123A|nr:hypothetical protein [Marinobacter sp. SS8-8]
MKPTRVTIKNLFAGYACAGMDPQHFYENLNEEQRIGAQLDFIEARARLLATRPNDGKDGVPANVQRDAKRLYRSVQQAVAAMSQDQMIQACGFMLEAGVAMQQISTQLAVAQALDVTKKLQENEEHILRGRKTVGSASKGGDSKNEPWKEIRPLFQPYINGLYQRNPHHSYAELQRKAAEHFRVSISMVKKWTENPSKM